jgi:hypothetical protein
MGGVYKRKVFAERIPTRHCLKHLDWKEMYAVLHSFLLWHESWTVHLACDNIVMVDALNNHSINGASLQPLQSILLVATVYDTAIQVFWIPSEENKVADAASRFDYKRLADLGLQISHCQLHLKASTLRQNLNSSFTTPSLHQPVTPITTQEDTTSSSVESTGRSHFWPHSKRSCIGLQLSWSPQSQ